MADLARHYTYSTALTAAGVNLAGLTVDQIRDLIASASAHVEGLTDQVFAPVVDTARTWDGRGRRLAFDPQLLRILQATSVSINWGRTDNRHNEPEYPDTRQIQLLTNVAGTVALAATDFVVRDRWIERIRGDFPWGPACVVVNGVFGWLDPAKAVVSTTTTAILNSNATSITVVDSAGFEIRDIVLIGTGLYGVLTNVAVAAGPPIVHTLSFDSIGTIGTALASGTTVRTWGKVPRAVQDLTTFMVHRIIEENRSIADGQQIVDPLRIRREQTDRYMYELFPPSEAVSGSVTGSGRHDITVRRYSRPALALAI